MDEKLIREFLDKNNVFEVVGASRNHKKYGHQVYRDLWNAGYRVYLVNPNANGILGDKCYPSLEALPVKPGVADLVVPPKVTDQVVKTCKRLGIQKVGMHPGSEPETAINSCREKGMDVVHGLCVMIERRKRQNGNLESSFMHTLHPHWDTIRNGLCFCLWFFKWLLVH